VRADGDSKIYKIADFSDGAVKAWIPTAEDFKAAGHDFNSVYVINKKELELYKDGGELKIIRNDQYLPTPAPVKNNPGLYTADDIRDGDLIRADGESAVWIVKINNGKKFKRWLFGPQIFKAYGHLGFNKVKLVSKETLDAFKTVGLIRLEGDPKIYNLTDFKPGESAVKSWIKSAEDFQSAGNDFDSVYVVNQKEFKMYKAE
jgi:hypothetical protein